MKRSIYERACRGYRFSGKRQEGPFVVYQMENQTGRGELMGFDVMPGIQLLYNHLYMDTCYQRIPPCPDFLQINHCLEGCYECEASNGTTLFLGEGDLSVNDLGAQEILASRIPLGRYTGISVLLELEPAQRSLSQLFPKAGIDLFALRDRLCLGDQCFLLRARPEIDRIFRELYQIDDRIRETYTVLKMVELLLFLSLTGVEPPLPRFSRSVVNSTKAVYHLLMQSPCQKWTVRGLCAEFHISETNLQQCFKSICGQPIGAFLKEKRMHQAAFLLCEREDLTVGQVAQTAGYENQSKFSAAFKAVMGQTPLAYRRGLSPLSAGLEQK